ncbi:uncharacterized protein AB675_1472 [Cyphellophora attinorum]|uniref:Uncharacterized protein n=1 Tax=Cyphellophora attinorum TaxID=1664694 RepID=A0A0N1NYK1_9EURO|nr:uncharacterized protein AB675_1472 [Phialophora attinorum]KPI37315.1 hypothetical protein AB675_1472 [Phialophora attinorum]
MSIGRDAFARAAEYSENQRYQRLWEQAHREGDWYAMQLENMAFEDEVKRLAKEKALAHEAEMKKVRKIEWAAEEEMQRRKEIVEGKKAVRFADEVEAGPSSNIEITKPLKAKVRDRSTGSMDYEDNLPIPPAPFGWL